MQVILVIFYVQDIQKFTGMCKWLFFYRQHISAVLFDGMLGKKNNDYLNQII